MTITPHPAFRRPGGETACQGRAGCVLCMMCRRLERGAPAARQAARVPPVELAALVWNGDRPAVTAWRCQDFAT